MANEPLKGRRLAEVKQNKTKKDWAKFIKRISDEMYSNAKKITLVKLQFYLDGLDGLGGYVRISQIFIRLYVIRKISCKFVALKKNIKNNEYDSAIDFFRDFVDYSFVGYIQIQSVCKAEKQP